MQTDGCSAPQAISQERIQHCKEQGARARRECRSRNTSGFFPGLERKAFEEGWDGIQAKEDAMFRDRESARRVNGRD